MTQPDPGPRTISWEIDIPLVTNPRIIKAVAFVAAMSCVIPVLLIGLVLGSQGELRGILVIARAFAVVGLGIFVTALVVMAVFFGNRIRTRYTVDAQGIMQETVDERSRAASRLAAMAGSVGRSPVTIGAGLLAAGRESERLQWAGAFALEACRDRHVLVLRNAWRPLMEVYCTPDNHAEVEALVRAHMARHQTGSRVAERSPLPGYFGHTALILLASLAIFALFKAFGLDVLLPLLMLCFALATLWLVPLFGYVVLLLNALILVVFVGVLLERQASFLQPGESYRHYEVLSAADWGHLALGLIALGYLAWFAWRAVCGRMPSLLSNGRIDMGE